MFRLLSAPAAVISMIIVGGTLTSTSSFAQALAPVEARKEGAVRGELEGLSGLVGIGVEYSPDMPAGKNYSVSATPIFYGMYNDLIYATAGEIGLYVPINKSAWRVKAGLGYEPGRAKDDDLAVANLNEIDATAVFAGGLIYQGENFAIGLSAEQDIGDKGKGLVTFLGGSYDWHMYNNKLTLTAHADISYANDEHLKTEYGITADEALASLSDVDPKYHYTTYTPKSGLKSYGIGGSFRYRFSERFMAVGSASYELFGSAAKDSPFIKAAGKDYESEVLVGIAYSF